MEHSDISHKPKLIPDEQSKIRDLYQIPTFTGMTVMWRTAKAVPRAVLCCRN